MEEFKEIRALSLSRPWPWTILLDHPNAKKVENRSRNIGNYEGWCLLHAAKSWDYVSTERTVHTILGEHIASKVPKDEKADPTGFVALVQILGLVRPDEPGHLVFPYHNWAWRFDGSFAYVIGDIIRLERVYQHPGSRGFWRVPEDVRHQIASDAVFKDHSVARTNLLFTESRS